MLYNCIIIILIIIVILIYIIKNKYINNGNSSNKTDCDKKNKINEYFNEPKYCYNCENQNLYSCSQCINCGVCFNGKNNSCVLGNENGPIFNQDCLIYNYGEPVLDKYYKNDKKYNFYFPKWKYYWKYPEFRRWWWSNYPANHSKDHKNDKLPISKNINNKLHKNVSLNKLHKNVSLNKSANHPKGFFSKKFINNDSLKVKRKDYNNYQLSDLLDTYNNNQIKPQYYYVGSNQTGDFNNSNNNIRLGAFSATNYPYSYGRGATIPLKRQTKIKLTK